MRPRAPSLRSVARLAGCLVGPWVLFAAVQESARPPLQPPAPAVPVRPEVLPGLETYACASCHEAVAREWARTTHALAWLDEVYQAELATKKRPELCHGCHAPEPLLAGAFSARPDARETLREHGVACESCHQDEHGAIHGPRGTPTEAHASRASELLTAPGSNQLCAACHSTNIGPVIGIARDALPFLAERGLTCVGCHLAPVEQSFATGAPVRAGRSHELQTPRDPAFLRRAFGLALEQGATGSVLVLSNEAGHRVPGLIGRQIAFEAELLDAAGAVLARQELLIDERAYLPLDGKREIRFTQAGAALRVRGRHRDPRAAEAVSFLDETLVAQ